MFKVRVFTSKKGNKSFALICDLGYGVKYLNFDVNTLAELLKVSVSKLYEYENGDYPIK